MTDIAQAPSVLVTTADLRARLDAAPAGLWTRCPQCAAGLYGPRLERNLRVCPECAYLFRLGATERIAQLADEGSFEELDPGLAATDPLGFADTTPYTVRLERQRAKTGLADAAVYGTAALGGRPAVLYALDFGFQGGSMGSVVGEKFHRAAELALAQRVPLVAVATSGGARMQEGVFSLLQMAKTAAAVTRLREAGVPFFCVLADPVYGGVSASFAALGDVIVAETGARAGFAGPKVIEQTIREKLPAGFQTAEFLLEHGHIDAVVPRKELRPLLVRLVHVHGARVVDEIGDGEVGPRARVGAPRDTAARSGRDAWATVQTARDGARPHLGEYVERVFDLFIELRGDRWREDDPSILGGLAMLAGMPVVVVGHRKGRGTKEGIAHNFGMPHPSGYRKAARLMRYAERFGLPLVTVIDTPGAYPGLRAEQENQSGAIAENLALLAGLHTPVVSLVIGEGGSGGALALGVCDRLLMLANTTYSVISPEGCAAILFGDADRAAQAAAALRLTARDLHRAGVADEVVAEPAGGAQADHAATAAAVRAALLQHLQELRAEDPATRVRRRQRRIGRFGSFADPAPTSDERTRDGHAR